MGAKHSAKLDTFGTAFLGVRGKPGAVKNFFTEVAKSIMTDYAINSMTFADYVSTEFLGRVGYSGDAYRFLMEQGMEKVPSQTVAELAWQYSQEGAALGATHPQIMREMFGRTHVGVPKEKWEFARAAGLDISPEQVLMSYEEVEEAENEVFMAYCQECCPRLYSILTS